MRDEIALRILVIEKSTLAAGLSFEIQKVMYARTTKMMEGMMKILV